MLNICKYAKWTMQRPLSYRVCVCVQSYGCGRDGSVMHVIVEERVHVQYKKNIRYNKNKIYSML